MKNRIPIFLFFLLFVQCNLLSQNIVSDNCAAISEFSDSEKSYKYFRNPIDCSIEVELFFPDTTGYIFLWEGDSTSKYLHSRKYKTFSNSIGITIKGIGKNKCCSLEFGIDFMNLIEFEFVQEEECKSSNLSIVNIDTNIYKILWYENDLNKKIIHPTYDPLNPKELKQNRMYFLNLTSKKSGCVFIDSISTNSLYNQLNDVDIAVEMEDCKISSGRISIDTLSFKGGQPPFYYEWSTLESTSSIRNLDIGTYGLTISDSYGCKLEKSFEVNPSKEFVKLKTMEHFCIDKDKHGSIEIETKLYNNELPFIDWTGPINSRGRKTKLDGLKPGIYCAYITYEKSMCSFEVCYEVLPEKCN